MTHLFPRTTTGRWLFQERPLNLELTGIASEHIFSFHSTHHQCQKSHLKDAICNTNYSFNCSIYLYFAIGGSSSIPSRCYMLLQNDWAWWSIKRLSQQTDRHYFPPYWASSNRFMLAILLHPAVFIARPHCMQKIRRACLARIQMSRLFQDDIVQNVGVQWGIIA